MSKLLQNLGIIMLKVPYHRFYPCLGYKSAISLDSLYPNSSLRLTTPAFKPSSASDKFSGYIPVNDLDITYSRSSGPGGQNVNKVNTKVEVKFEISKANWINEDIKSKLFEKFKNRITKEGYAIFRSDLTRSQHLNLADCLEKIRSAVRNCETVPQKELSEETQEKIRRRIERATMERLSMKRDRSQVKNQRSSPEIV